MNSQIINSRKEAIEFLEQRSFKFKLSRCGITWYECGQMEFEIGYVMCAYYRKRAYQSEPKDKRLIWWCVFTR